MQISDFIVALSETLVVKSGENMPITAWSNNDRFCGQDLSTKVRKHFFLSAQTESVRSIETKPRIVLSNM